MILPEELLDAMIPDEQSWDADFKEYALEDGARAHILAQFFRQTPIGIVILDSEGNVSYINKSACEMFDVERKLEPSLTWTRLRELRRMKDQGERELGEDDDPFGIAMKTRRKTSSNITFVDRERGTEDWMMVTSYPLYADSEHKELTGAAVEMLDISDYKGMQEMLYHQATHDLLTGLSNRASLSGSMAKAFARSKRHGTCGAILFIDVDKFKRVNDSLGHASGDSLLAKIADRMMKELRETDVIARVGGDEFAVLLADIRPEDVRTVAGEVASRICRAIAMPYTVRGEEAYVTASIGISIYPKDAIEEDTLLARADHAMYMVKESGRNGWMFFGDTEIHQE